LLPDKPPSGSILRHRVFQANEADRIPPGQKAALKEQDALNKQENKTCYDFTLV
jgi:hypothetical protein